MLAMKYAMIKGMDDITTERFMMNVTLTKTIRNLPDAEILQVAMDRLKNEKKSEIRPRC